MVHYGSDMATLDNACVYISHTTALYRSVPEATVRAASPKIHAYVSFDLKIMVSVVAAIYVNLPTSVTMTYCERKKLSFSRITLVNGNTICNRFFINIKYRKSFAQICNGNLATVHSHALILSHSDCLKTITVHRHALTMSHCPVVHSHMFILSYCPVWRQ